MSGYFCKKLTKKIEGLRIYYICQESKKICPRAMPSKNGDPIPNITYNLKGCLLEKTEVVTSKPEVVKKDVEKPVKNIEKKTASVEQKKENHSKTTNSTTKKNTSTTRKRKTTTKKNTKK